MQQIATTDALQKMEDCEINEVHTRKVSAREIENTLLVEAEATRSERIGRTRRTNNCHPFHIIFN